MGRLVMTPTEYARLLADVTTRWPHTDWPPATIRQLRTDLARYTLNEATDAIATLYAEGLQWAPSPSRIVAATAEQATNRRRYPTSMPALDPPSRMTGYQYRELFWDGKDWDHIITAHSNTRKD